MLYVDGFFPGHSLLYGRLLEILAGAELTDGTGLFELAFEAFESAFDIVTIFYGYYNHAFITSFFFGDAKVRIFLLFANIH